MVKYVAVGFKVTQSRSIFYFNEENLNDFCRRLKAYIEKQDPDFVSLRMVR